MLEPVECSSLNGCTYLEYTIELLNVDCQLKQGHQHPTGTKHKCGDHRRDLSHVLVFNNNLILLSVLHISYMNMCVNTPLHLIKIPQASAADSYGLTDPGECISSAKNG
jgi:hypothetical protein